MNDFSLFEERKAAQAAAYLIRCAGGKLSLLKTMRLMYLAERLSFERYGDPITGDSFVSMPNGPVLSMTLNFMNGFAKSCEQGWDSWIADREKNELAVVEQKRKVKAPEEGLLALSDSDIECLKDTWDRFRHMDRWQLVNYTHSDSCPEWESPGNSSRPIPPARLLRALGYAPDQVEVLTRRLHEQRYINASFVD